MSQATPSSAAVRRRGIDHRQSVSASFAHPNHFSHLSFRPARASSSVAAGPVRGKSTGALGHAVEGLRWPASRSPTWLLTKSIPSAISCASSKAWTTAGRRKERRFMSLVLKPNDASPGDYHVMHGELQVGQIHKRIVALRPESQWLKASSLAGWRWRRPLAHGPTGWGVGGGAGDGRQLISGRPAQLNQRRGGCPWAKKRRSSPPGAGINQSLTLYNPKGIGG